MFYLQRLRAASTRHDVANLLQYTPKALSYILYKQDDAAKYHSFAIAKRDGTLRMISAPSPPLKLLQRRLADLLQNCVDEINQDRHFPDQLAHGFKRKRSIITNGVKHRKKRYVFNIDLENFFPSINFGRVRGLFIKDSNFLLHPAVATVLAQVACHENSLPQGSPCSPVISNLVGHTLDIQLCRLAATNGCTYSRYADDITFSTNKPNFPSDIAIPSPDAVHTWHAGDRLQQVVAHAGFTINDAKTRMQYRNSRQAVTGLVVNKKVNVAADYRRTVRAMAQRLFISGKFQHVRSAADVNGVYVRTQADGTLDELQGMLGHINMVDRYNAEMATKAGSGKSQAKTLLRPKEKVYRRFLLYSRFYAAPSPVVVCEGKTDNVYLIHAIRSLAAAYARLATVSANNEVALNIRILKTLQTSVGRVLNLGGGASDLDGLIDQYLDEIQNFKAPGLAHAVVLVADNDSGATDILNTIKRRTKNAPNRNAPFIPIGGNLYLVLTPLLANGAPSTIEDCFDATIRNLVLGGKTFNPKKNADPALYFGKHILSQYVRQNAAKINFNGFVGLLDRLVAAIEDHRAKQAQFAPAGVGAGSQQP
jgi:retron-type reverse transcriptase